MQIVYFICGFLIIFIFVSSTQTYPGPPLSFPTTFNTKLEGRSAACGGGTHTHNTTKPLKRKENEKQVDYNKFTNTLI